MDIFTTQLTRVVPVPIKPTNLKVKALLKESAASELKEDVDHLDDHNNYVTTAGDHQSHHQQHKDKAWQDKPIDKTQPKDEKSVITQGEDRKPHLDIFV
jgi:hypothetical protein